MANQPTREQMTEEQENGVASGSGGELDGFMESGSEGGGRDGSGGEDGQVREDKGEEEEEDDGVASRSGGELDGGGGQDGSVCRDGQDDDNTMALAMFHRFRQRPRRASLRGFPCSSLSGTLL
jgi:hypothetical protein